MQSRCQFIYLRRGGPNSLSGGRCDREALFFHGSLCELHQYQRAALSESRRQGLADVLAGSLRPTQPPSSEAFPRTPLLHEMRTWVDAARSATSPKANRQRACVFCGQLWSALKELTPVGIDEVVQFKHMISASNGGWTMYYSHVPSHHFHYSPRHAGLNGSPLCRSSFRSMNDS
jgi:hypothetical protein